MSEDPNADVMVKVANFGLSEPLYLSTISNTEHDASIIAPGKTLQSLATQLTHNTHRNGRAEETLY